MHCADWNDGWPLVSLATLDQHPGRQGAVWVTGPFFHVFPKNTKILRLPRSTRSVGRPRLWACPVPSGNQSFSPRFHKELQNYAIFARRCQGYCWPFSINLPAATALNGNRSFFPRFSKELLNFAIGSLHLLALAELFADLFRPITESVIFPAISQRTPKFRDLCAALRGAYWRSSVIIQAGTALYENRIRNRAIRPRNGHHPGRHGIVREPVTFPTFLQRAPKFRDFCAGLRGSCQPSTWAVRASQGIGRQSRLLTRFRSCFANCDTARQPQLS